MGRAAPPTCLPSPRRLRPWCSPEVTDKQVHSTSSGPGSGQAIEERTGFVESDTTVATPPHVQYLWDIRYVDAPVLRWRDMNADGDFADAGDETLYYATDANWNVTALVTPDGAVAERYLYDAYGEVTVLNGAHETDPDVNNTTVFEWDPDTASTGDGASDLGNELLYGGYRHDSETGLYHVRHRYYDAALGRWINRDPAGHIGGANLYAYASGNPVIGIDPSGLQSMPDYTTWPEEFPITAIPDEVSYWLNLANAYITVAGNTSDPTIAVGSRVIARNLWVLAQLNEQRSKYELGRSDLDTPRYRFLATCDTIRRALLATWGLPPLDLRLLRVPLPTIERSPKWFLASAIAAGKQELAARGEAKAAAAAAYNAAYKEAERRAAQEAAMPKIGPATSRLEREWFVDDASYLKAREREVWRSQVNAHYADRSFFGRVGEMIFGVGNGYYNGMDAVFLYAGGRGAIANAQLRLQMQALVYGRVRSANPTVRPFAERLADFERAPGNWSLESIHAEGAVSRRAAGGVSEQMIYRNTQTGETMVRHRLTGPNGRVLEDHFRPTYRPRVGEVD